jgi:hypothetical protein
VPAGGWVPVAALAVGILGAADIVLVGTTPWRCAAAGSVVVSRNPGLLVSANLGALALRALALRVLVGGFRRIVVAAATRAAAWSCAATAARSAGAAGAGWPAGRGGPAAAGAAAGLAAAGTGCAWFVG